MSVVAQMFFTQGVNLALFSLSARRKLRAYTTIETRYSQYDQCLFRARLLVRYDLFQVTGHRRAGQNLLK